MTIAIDRPSVQHPNFTVSISLSSHLQGWVYRLGWHLWSYSTILGVMALAVLSLVALHLHQTVYTLLHPSSQHPRSTRKSFQ